MEIILSDHASQRSAQRNVSFNEILFIVEHGKLVRKAGVNFRQLRAKDWPDELHGNHPYRRLIGTTVVLCKCGQYVVTVYREEDAFRKDQRKQKYGAICQVVTCPRCQLVQVA